MHCQWSAGRSDWPIRTRHSPGAVGSVAPGPRPPAPPGPRRPSPRARGRSLAGSRSPAGPPLPRRSGSRRRPPRRGRSPRRAPWRSPAVPGDTDGRAASRDSRRSHRARALPAARCRPPAAPRRAAEGARPRQPPAPRRARRRPGPGCGSATAGSRRGRSSRAPMVAAGRLATVSLPEAMPAGSKSTSTSLQLGNGNSDFRDGDRETLVMLVLERRGPD